VLGKFSQAILNYQNVSTNTGRKFVSTEKKESMQMEKRSLVRNCAQIPVACSSLTSKSPSVVSHGHMVNCSGGGTCLKLNHMMHEGSIVMIKAISWGMNDPPDGFRTLALAEVKWSRPLEIGLNPNYAVGLRYLPN
jgi:rhamnose utilization protein RhaD (predicted bifunctional aldolase and dehydrogenase)